MPTAPYKAAICYGRYSDPTQSKGYSLERQKTLAAEFAAERGWTIEKVIADEGRSAFHGANRVEGAALHEFELEAKNGLHKGKVLVAENIDRLSRQGAKAAAQLIWALNEHGVDVATYHDGYVYQASNSGDMMELFSVIIKAQVAYEESLKKSQRTKDTWKKRFVSMEAGTQKRPVPHIPAWVRKIDDGHELDEYRAKVLNEIFDVYIDGMGIGSIANMLNARNEPVWSSKAKETRNGWFYGYIWRLLTKRASLGEYVTLDGTTVATDFYPQAISADKFNRAQSTLSMRKSNQRRGKNQNRNLLAQMVFCADCEGGANFEHTTDCPQTYVRKSDGKRITYRRKTYRRLRCDRARRQHACDNSTVLNYDVVEATIMQQMLPQLVQRVDEDGEPSKLREAIAELVRLQDAGKTRLDNLIDAIADGGSKALIQRVTALEEQIEGYSQQIEAKQQALAVTSSKPSTVDDVALIDELRAKLESEDEDERIFTRGKVNMSLRRLITRIEINSNDTFTVRPDDHSMWLFDADGVLLEAEQRL